MRELTCIVDPETGDLTLEGLGTEEAQALVGDLLPAPAQLNCGRPLDALVPARSRLLAGESTLRVQRIYHGAVAEGPGRRSVLQASGCTVRCPGCYSRDTWDALGGVEMDVDAVVDALLDPSGEPRDGVTLLGGEPLDQPEAIAAVMRGLKERGEHLVLYSGRTLESLAKRPEPGVREALLLADVLIDGPFIESLAGGAGEWRGSRNQRVIPLPGLWL